MLEEKWKKLQLKKSVQEFSILIFFLIAFVRGNEGIIMLAAEDREVN